MAAAPAAAPASAAAPAPAAAAAPAADDFNLFASSRRTAAPVRVVNTRGASPAVLIVAEMHETAWVSKKGADAPGDAAAGGKGNDKKGAAAKAGSGNSYRVRGILLGPMADKVLWDIPASKLTADREGWLCPRQQETGTGKECSYHSMAPLLLLSGDEVEFKIFKTGLEYPVAHATVRGNPMALRLARDMVVRMPLKSGLTESTFISKKGASITSTRFNDPNDGKLLAPALDGLPGEEYNKIMGTLCLAHHNKHLLPLVINPNHVFSNSEGRTGAQLTYGEELHDIAKGDYSTEMFMPACAHVAGMQLAVPLQATPNYVWMRARQQKRNCLIFPEAPVFDDEYVHAPKGSDGVSPLVVKNKVVKPSAQVRFRTMAEMMTYEPATDSYTTLTQQIDGLIYSDVLQHALLVPDYAQSLKYMLLLLPHLRGVLLTEITKDSLGRIEHGTNEIAYYHTCGMRSRWFATGEDRLDKSALMVDLVATLYAAGTRTPRSTIVALWKILGAHDSYVFADTPNANPAPRDKEDQPVVVVPPESPTIINLRGNIGRLAIKKMVDYEFFLVLGNFPALADDDALREAFSRVYPPTPANAAPTKNCDPFGLGAEPDFCVYAVEREFLRKRGLIEPDTKDPTVFLDVLEPDEDIYSNIIYPRLYEYETTVLQLAVVKPLARPLDAADEGDDAKEEGDAKRQAHEAEEPPAAPDAPQQE